MRMAVPAAYGGPEADPLTMLTAIETVARADGAAGWCTMIASTTSSQSPVPAARHRPGDLRRCRRRHRRRVRPERPWRRGRRPRHGHRPLAVGERHAALPVDPRRHEVRRRHVPPVLVRAVRRDVPRHVVHVRAARHGVARLLRRRRRACRSIARSSPGAAGRRSTSRSPASRTSPCSPPASLGQPRHRPASDRRAGRPRRGQAAAVLVEDAGREPLHPGRAGAGRGGAAIGAGVPARRGRPGVGPGRRRRACRRRRPHRHPPRRRQRRAAQRRGGRHRRTRSPAGRASTTRACCSAASATPTCRPSTSRWRRSCTRPPAASSSARTSTRPLL